MYPTAPSIVFGLGALIAGLATLPLPETLGVKIPDTITELERQRRGSHISELDDDLALDETEMAKLRA